MKRTWLRILLVVVVLAAILGAAYRPAVDYWRARNRPTWRLAKVVRGEIIETVDATGEVKPVFSVPVGAFVSGQIMEVPGEFNHEVKKGELLAVIDDRLYRAQMEREVATLKTRQSELKRVEALLQQAVNDQRRGLDLQARNEKFISLAEMDQLKFNHLSLVAQRDVALASIEQAQANLNNAQANLDYCEITSPVDGIIIDRKVDRGQTVASSFQTPELFVLAPKIRDKIHVHASVDEADIGYIRNAQTQNQPVYFTVDAYPEDLFHGAVEEVRFSSTRVQNVVTYPVIVGTPNRELKLLPGMTASLSFQIDQREDVLRIPNAALRFYPKPEYVHPDDRHLIEGSSDSREDASENEDLQLSAREKSRMRSQSKNRHVWVAEGEFLRAVEVKTGLIDSRYSELVSGDLQEGQELVTGATVKSPFGS